MTFERVFSIDYFIRRVIIAVFIFSVFFVLFCLKRFCCIPFSYLFECEIRDVSRNFNFANFFSFCRWLFSSLSIVIRSIYLFRWILGTLTKQIDLELIISNLRKSTYQMTSNTSSEIQQKKTNFEFGHKLSLNLYEILSGWYMLTRHLVTDSKQF